MNRWSSIIWFLLSGLLFNVESQAAPGQENFSSQDAVTAFKPSLAVVIGILAGLTRSESRFSGIDKTVIESLPFFRFCSLKGSKEGLECAVCLSKFEDIEILRLLPKCKHAFHIDCVDQWLEKHSSCPLCRHKVSAEDLAILTYSNSLRFLWNQSELRENSNLELFVQREEDHHGSSRFSIGSSFRKVEKGVKEEESVLIQEEEDDNDDEKILHKINHKIIVSDVVLKNRWSSVSSSDLMYLNSELVHAMSKR
ncbi:E3 ubiquitin-protein ligase ATL42 [Vitis vinifera]|uniref:RING-type E3 ubiquitin transferase n=1 Tax=Vitis vinifera TaxID=29760 RepID=A0A438DSG8_VITVI|nr:E3 ubiquitin-protein ligase ATL42 [Vitis vinifera]